MKAHPFDATTTVIAAAVLSTLTACGPEAPDHPPGALEYETPASAFYRLDRRVEIIPLDPVLS